MMDPEEWVAALTRDAPAVIGVVGLLHEEESTARTVGHVGDADLAVEPTHARPGPVAPALGAAELVKIGPARIIDQAVVLVGRLVIGEGPTRGRRANERRGHALGGQDVGVDRAVERGLPRPAV